MSDDYGFYGKGMEGYAHYTEAVEDSKNGGGGGGKPPSGKTNGGGIAAVIVIAVLIYLIFRACEQL